MEELAQRIANLAPEKRRLLELLLAENEERARPDETPAGSAEAKLRAIWEGVLGVAGVGLYDDYFELGGDSIQAIQIVARARQQGLRLSTTDLFERPTISALVAGMGRASTPNQEAVFGPAPFTPIQRWFLEQRFRRPGHWNMAVLLESPGNINLAALRVAMLAVYRHHDALRLRLEGAADTWTEEILPFRETDLVSEYPAAGMEQVCAAVQESFDLAKAPLVKAAVFQDAHAEGASILIAAHHMVMDGVSLRILLEDLGSAYGQALAGVEPQLPAKTVSYTAWARAMQDYATSPEVEAEAAWWIQQTAASRPRVPLDFSGGDNTEESAETVVRTLEEPEVRSGVRELLLAAFATAWKTRTGQDEILIDLEGHGRESGVQQDVSRTVGWFTAMFPVRLRCVAGNAPSGNLEAVRADLGRIPQHGVGYGLLRYLSRGAAGEMLKRAPRAQVLFNYLGRFQEPGNVGWRATARPCGPFFGPENQRGHVLQVMAYVVDGELRVEWIFSRNLHRRQTIEDLADEFIAALRSLSQTPSRMERAVAASDFPESRLEDRDLADLKERMGGLGRVEDIYRLSPAQESMLFEVATTADRGLYVEQGTCTLTGPLDRPAFEAAIRTVAARHASMRTCFHWEGLSRPVQVVLRDAACEVTWDGDETAIIRRNAESGFNLTQAPLLRASVVPIAHDRHRLIWCIHHLIHDAWSTQVMLHEVAECYSALAKGARYEASIPAQFRDFIAWLGEQDNRGAQAYWKSALEGYRGERAQAENELELRLCERIASPELSRRIASAARTIGVTQHTLAAGAWALFLASRSKTGDVVFGSVTAGHPVGLPGVEGITGVFINTLPLRVRVRPELAAGDWLRELQHSQTEALRYEHTPPADIRRWCGIPPDARLFSSVLVFQNTFDPASVGHARDWAIGIHGIRSLGHSNVPLTMRMTPGESMFLEIFGQSDEVGTRTLDRMIELLDALSSRSTEPVGRILQTLATQASRPKFAAKVVSVSSASLVRERGLSGEAGIPWLIEPNGIGLDLEVWAREHREHILQRLAEKRALLFRGFFLDGTSAFQRVVNGLVPGLMPYHERSTPRTQVADKIYTSTEYPAHQHIPLHNEFSYALTWPLKIFFHCVVAPADGGETPLADSRRVFQALPAALRQRFIDKQVMYVRNYGGGIDLPWQDAFQTGDPAEVEEYCRRAPMEWEWLSNGRLRTRQVRGAVASHPHTGEPVWFNQAHLFHVASHAAAVGQSLRTMFAEEDLPRNAYFGDGSAIGNEEIGEILAAYQAHTVSFPWRAGDVLLLDNMTVAHGRNPYRGDRKILVGMGDPFQAEGAAGA